MTLIPNDYQKGINEAFEISNKEIDALKAENKILKEEITRLKFMIDNGLGWEDMQNDTFTLQLP